jgi:ribosomal protein S4E
VCSDKDANLSVDGTNIHENKEAYLPEASVRRTNKSKKQTSTKTLKTNSKLSGTAGKEKGRVGNAKKKTGGKQVKSNLCKLSNAQEEQPR